MKYLLVLSLLLQGCVSGFSYSYQEECALSGMKLDGIDNNQSKAVAYNYNYGPIVTNGYSTSVRCKVAENDSEREAIKEMGNRVYPLAEYNNGVKGRGLLTGLGYLCGILPGIALYFYFDHQRDLIVKEYIK